ncbi:cytochrome c oxidase assembly protein [Nitrolancea hollandica]|uniref:Cytochrome c oxidase caa3-type, assembly factor CtaG-related protein n=1 Tax=Nitrolancea hollandica Lb TaxID=1129897 RepID=I4ELR8_9BACT|nr:cytochrome c oxidase assembly protein [Nitrolancea hollandica]CCF85630.1 conserved membrane hypothetical protein [Nitrolancea hollandica Lb]
MLTPTSFWSQWNVDPWLLLPLIVAAALFVRGLRRAGSGGAVTRGWGPIAFAGGLITLFVALVWPLDPLSDALFTAHMVQYTLLTVLAPALIVFSGSSNLLLEGLPERASARVIDWWNQTAFPRRAWGVLTLPLVIGLIDVGTLYFWHLPGVYELALRSWPLHALELFSFLVAGLLAWRLVRHPSRRGLRGYGVTLVFLMSTSILGVLLGMAYFFTSPWYSIYQISAPAWGLTPRLDQQIGGIVLGVVPEFFDVIPFLLVLAALLRAEEQRAEDRIDAGQIGPA